jgi:hypothetical protein
MSSKTRSNDDPINKERTNLQPHCVKGARVPINAPTVNPIKGGMYTLFCWVSLFELVKAYTVNDSMAVPKISTKNASAAVTGSLDSKVLEWKGSLSDASIKERLDQCQPTYEKYSPKALADSVLFPVPRTMLFSASN